MKWSEKKRGNVRTLFSWWPYSVPTKDGLDWYWLEWITVKEELSYYGATFVTLLGHGKDHKPQGGIVVGKVDGSIEGCIYTASKEDNHE